jgi:hypothetical protein
MMPDPANHIIHDTDRDGWGSAAMLLAELGHENCHLHPMRTKDVSGVFNLLPPDANVFVLDLPALVDWNVLRERPVTWVDHHLAAWNGSPPPWVRVVLPADDRPTTTMKLLVTSGLVTVPHAMRFVAAMCRRSPPFAWGQVFDAMRDDVPEVDNLSELLAQAPSGGPIPASLQPLLLATAKIADAVDAVLASAATFRTGPIVRIDINDAHRIPLARYSLAAERQHPGLVRVLVHRRERLYVGRDSRTAGVDLIAHFRSRGLDPKGHPYVCTVSVHASAIDDEIAALGIAVEGRA